MTTLEGMTLLKKILKKDHPYMQVFGNHLMCKEAESFIVKALKTLYTSF